MKLKLVLFIQIVSLMTQMISSNLLLHEVSLNQNASEVTRQENFPLKVKKSVTLKEKMDLWDEAIVYYQIDDIFNGTQRRLIKQGLRMWEESSCIQFVQRNSNIHRDYVAITILECGCCYQENYQGRRNKGRSKLSLAKGCEDIEIILHELGHVLGFYHEHQHPDRDQWVQINKRNIDQGYEPEFQQLSRAHVDTLGLPYDYQSVMHYPSDAYAYYNFWTTIVPKQAINGTVPNIARVTLRLLIFYINVQLAEVFFMAYIAGFIEPPVSTNDSDSDLAYCQWRIVASKGERIILDVSTLNISMNHNCASDFLEIRNGHSDKSLLVFFGKKCGSTSSTLVNVNNPFTLESPNYPFNYRAYDNCKWAFETPENHTIKVKFEFFRLEDSSNCGNDFVEVEEIDIDGSSKVIGRFCGNRSPWELNLQVNKVSIQFVSDVVNDEAGFSAMITAEPIV
ncbi:Similar to tld: Dorsal-ventral patterning protein tolloid (Drosophila melanogaster) [Cotesia congregata]|uniref:Metalloendopeptidase n=1 Tax=Cotesia congregata TaxID=51543 RepID=A0A8J2H5D6_COTCN|nr:Similar to tld: Dorsal-ventral patterning protein tolloid (Drosophila melanogaster) [Cotesia congregata]